jgi:predicted AlkP superfamily pyrophosphatase or phosphodiesterase
MIEIITANLSTSFYFQAKNLNKKKITLFAIAVFYFLVANSQKNTSNPLPRPKLVVGIVIDQMRWDYIYRYYNRYSSEGFKRMINEGFACENASINYTPTVTGIGHATIYTGSVPSIHGIAGNNFINQATGQNIYCTEDSTVSTVGSATIEAGKMSPRNLFTTTISDELKLATNLRSKVIGVAIKDRGSILPAGHLANAAYWFDSNTGHFISSTFYMQQLPQWVKRFNDQKLPEKYLAKDWKTLFNINTYNQSFPDDNPYEGLYSDHTSPTFPILTSRMFKSNFEILRSSPYGNTLTNEMAKAVIENEGLGQGDETDMIAISFSTPDYIGHKMGVNSIEIEDTYLRLDLEIASLFNFLDDKIGKGNYTTFLTSDHGAAHNSNLLMDLKIPAGLWPSSKILNELNKLLEAKFNVKGLIRSFNNYQVNLNTSLINKNKLDEESIKTVIIKFLKGTTGVLFVADLNNLNEAPIPTVLKERLINGYNSERSGDIAIVLKPGWYTGSPNATGTSHGSWYGYDAHIPLLWMGWGIKKGSTTRAINMTDIAPTIAALLNIQSPNGNVGEPILEILNIY